ncbi:hypothetical protein METHP14_840004 [Pseudomonas sp. P14-2025]
MEQRLTAHRRRPHFCGKPLDVYLQLSQQAGNVPHDPRPVVAHQLHGNWLPGARRLDPALGNQHANVVPGQPLQRSHKLGVILCRHRHPQNASKLPGHTRHAAFQPVTTVVGDALGNTFDLAGLVRGNYSQYKMIHKPFLVSDRAGRQKIGGSSQYRQGAATCRRAICTANRVLFQDLSGTIHLFFANIPTPSVTIRDQRVA